MIKRIGPITGMIESILNIIAEGNPFRNDVFHDVIGDIVIDTCIGFDTLKWETGINRDVWIIVQQYKNRELAEKGHNKWVKKINNNPQLLLKDLDLWGLNKLKEEE